MANIPKKQPPKRRKRERSMKNARSTLDTQRRVQAKICTHSTFRYRLSSTEQVCTKCGAVRQVKRGTQFDIEVVTDWAAVSLIEEAVDERAVTKDSD